MRKKLAALLVLVLLFVSMLPIMAFAEETQEPPTTTPTTASTTEPTTEPTTTPAPTPCTHNIMQRRTGSTPTPTPTPTPCTHAKAVYVNNGNGTHHRYCKDCGTHFKSESCVYTALPDDRGGAGHIKICGVCGGNVFEKHSDNNNNGKCDICGHDMNDLTTTDTSTGIDRAYTTGDSAAVLAAALLLVICVSAISLKKKHSV